MTSSRTEERNPWTRGLDTKSTIEILRALNHEDQRVALAVQRVLPQIARAVDAIVKSFRRGGRLVYIGAGTSGRLAVLDAAECPPTFGTRPKMVQALIAGGAKALRGAVEGAEDSASNGARDLAKAGVTSRDVVVGIAASGTTRYVLGGMEWAKRRGSLTVAVTSDPRSPLARVAKIAITPETGQEAIAGSTRMKAGTAQKMVLNMLSTGAMAKLGYVYDNLMVNVHLKNRKLAERGIRILEEATDLDRKHSVKALRKAGGSVPVAIFMVKRSVSKTEAERLLKAAKGHVRVALREK